jgi:phage terminase large subunit
MTQAWTTPDINWPVWSQFLWRPKRYKVPYGGRGSSKSWTVARALIELAIRPHLLFGPDKKSIRILCARELQNSIEESVHQLLHDQIIAMGYERWFLVEKRSIVCLVTGSEFIFSGIQKNVTKIKSMERIDICWVEEAEKVSSRSWEVIIPTVRQERSEIWVTFNPDQEEDPTYQRFILKTPDDAEVVLVNWRENPWFPDVLAKEKDYLFRVDPDAAMHVWEGKLNTRSNAQVLHDKWRVEAFTPLPGWYGPYFGADWGFSQDPTTLVKLWYDPAHNTLHIEYEAYGIGVELQDIAKMFKAIPESLIMIRKPDGNLAPAPIQHVIRADCARPETINYVCHYGFNVVAADKWSGSVEDGVAWLRGLDAIIIHPRCTHAIQEARLWKYKIDKLTQDVLPVLDDKHNHIWDAVRYAMAPAIKQTLEGQVIEAVAERVQIAPDLDDMEEAPAWLTSQ